MSSLPKAPKPIVSPAVYQNPYMAPNDFSEIHFNAYQTDTCTVKGPATSPNRSIQQSFINPPDGIAGTIAFDTTGRIITIRVTSTPGDPGATELLLIDPKSLEVLVNIFDRKSGRLIAQQAIFKNFPRHNSCENSLIAVNHSIIVENNYGNKSPASTLGPTTTVPGISRVDFDPATGNSHVVWVNKSISIPSVVSQLSLGDGCIYTYAKSSEGWYWAALDFETGDIVAQSEYVPWSNFLGGFLANNYYAGISIGPDGSAYLSVFGGIVAWRAC